MRRRTRNVILVILAVLAVLLALGALPGLLKSGDPYYLTATADGEWAGNDTAALADNETAVNVTELSERRFPHATEALAAVTPERPGQSEPYWKGPIGIKETFTHSPFDELDSLRQRNVVARSGDGVYVHDNETLYVLSITQETQ